MKNKLRSYLVTGQMGSGKTFLCQAMLEYAFRESLNLHYLSTDIIRQDLLESNKYKSLGVCTRDKLLEFFGREISAADGFIDRAKLSDLVYWEADALDFYSGIMSQAYRQVIREHQKKHTGILLVEWASALKDQALDLFDYNVILVHCQAEVQHLRLYEGDLGWETCKVRLLNQLSLVQSKIMIKRLQKEQSRGKFLLYDSSQIFDYAEMIKLIYVITAGLKIEEELHHE